MTFFKPGKKKMPLKRVLLYHGRMTPSMQEFVQQEQAGMCQKRSSVHIFCRCDNFQGLGLFGQISKHFKQTVASFLF